MGPNWFDRGNKTVYQMIGSAFRPLFQVFDLFVATEIPFCNQVLNFIFDHKSKEKRLFVYVEKYLSLERATVYTSVTS